MDITKAFESLGGRKFFGLVTLSSLMAVVAVFGGGLSTELSAGLVGLYVTFVGGNAFTTVKTFSGNSEAETPATVEAQPPIDLSAYDNEIARLTQEVQTANDTAQQVGQAVLQINQQLQAVRNLAAAAVKR